MSFFDLPILSALKTRMNYHAQRQVVLAQNVANAETPGYGARDLEKPDFRRLLAQPAAGVSGAGAVSAAALGPVRTQAGHMAACRRPRISRRRSATVSRSRRRAMASSWKTR